MDITNIVSQFASQSETRSLAPLVDRLTTHADVNRDGNVSSAEFRDFLSKLTAALDGAAPIDADHAPQASIPTTVPPPALPVEPVSTVTALRALAVAVAKVR